MATIQILPTGERISPATSEPQLSAIEPPIESALDVDDVLVMLRSDRQPDLAMQHPHCALVPGRGLRVGGRGMMDRQAASIAHIDDTAEKLQCINKAAFTSALGLTGP